MKNSKHNLAQIITMRDDNDPITKADLRGFRNHAALWIGLMLLAVAVLALI